MPSFIESVNRLATGISSGTLEEAIIVNKTIVSEVIPNLPEILLADDNASIATQKASEASVSANNALTQANRAESEADRAEGYANGVFNIKTNTIAEMEALTPINGDVCFVKDLDRGGIFIYDATKVGESNDGTNFSGWVRQYDGAVNVKWFGAKGDGVTDDSTSIQNAKNTGLSVYVPAGTYINILSIELLQGQEFFGDGKNSIISMSVYNNGHIIGIIGTTGNPITDCHVHDIALNCNSTVNCNGVGISYAENNIVNNVWVFNAGRKAYTLQYEVFNNIITDCYADGGASTFPIISFEDPTGTSKCSRNIVTNITLGICTDYIMSMYGGTDNIVENITCESSLRGISLIKSDKNTIENISTLCTNSLININDSHNNNITNIKNNGVSTVAIINTVTTPSTYNKFNKIVGEGTSTLITYGNNLQYSTFKDCEFKSSISNYQFLGFGSGSVGNIFNYCKLETTGLASRTILIEGSNNTIKNCNIVASVTAVKISAISGTVFINNTFSGAITSYALEGTTHTNTTLVGNKKANGVVQVAVDTVQINNSWNPKIMYNTSAPLTGTFKQSDIVYNTAAAASGFVGWICTTAGTPGTWKTFGAITA